MPSVDTRVLKSERRVAEKLEKRQCERTRMLLALPTEGGTLEGPEGLCSEMNRPGSQSSPLIPPGRELPADTLNFTQ